MAVAGAGLGLAAVYSFAHVAQETMQDMTCTSYGSASCGQPESYMSSSGGSGVLLGAIGLIGAGSVIALAAPKIDRDAQVSAFRAQIDDYEATN